MIKHYIYIYTLLIVVLACSCKAQQTDKKQYASIYTDLQELKLSGPVKTIRAYATYNRDNLTKDQINLSKATGFIEVFKLTRGYRNFDKNGMLIKSYTLLDSINQTLIDTINVYRKNDLNRYIYVHVYQEDDYKAKLKIKQNFKPSKWVFNPYRVNLNRQYYTTYDIIVKKDSTYKKHQDVYIYNIDAKGNITNQLMNHHWDKNLDGVIDLKEHYYRVDYEYNAKNQLVKKVYHLNPKIFDDRYYLDHDLQVGANKETPIEVYTYNDAGNLTSVFTYLNPQKTVLAYSAEYFYNDSNQLVRLKRRKATGMMGMVNSHFKRLNEFFFNDKGDVIKINSYENDEKTIHATYLYEYKKYDKYGNWLYMQMSIKDIPTKEPTMVVNRIIEYYKD